MNAISLYVSASRLLFSDSAEQNFSDLYRLVPYLRQSLSCTVCANLLVEPYSPQDICQHHVCRTCIGGRKNLKPSCVSCRNYQNYQANSQLRILLQCYKSLCKYILATPPIYSSMHKHLHVAGFVNGNNTAHSLAELIDEGARFHDEYKSNSGLPKSAFSILPCIFAPQQTKHHEVNQKHHDVQSYQPPATSTAVTVAPTPTASGGSGTINIIKPVASASGMTTITNQSSVNKITISTNKITSTTAGTAHHHHLAERKDLIATINSTKPMPNPPIKTVSNGSALYSVMYAGSGNKITIKRKTDDSCANNSNNMSAKEMLNMLSGNSSGRRASPVFESSGNYPVATSSTTFVQPQMKQVQSQPPQLQPQQLHHQYNINQQQTISTSQTAQAFKKPSTSKTKTLQKRKGCRCGNATPTPGKLTCCGQRCPCYVDSKSCVDCKCRGCRNPHRIDGFKVSLIGLPFSKCTLLINSPSFYRFDRKFQN